MVSLLDDIIDQWSSHQHKEERDEMLAALMVGRAGGRAHGGGRAEGRQEGAEQGTEGAQSRAQRSLTACVSIPLSP